MNLLLLVIICLFFNVAQSDYNPLTMNIFSGYKSRYNLYKSFFKLLLPLYYAVDPKVASSDKATKVVYFLLCYLACIAYFCLTIFFEPPKSHFSFSFQKTVLDWLLFGIGFSAFIQVTYDKGAVVHTDNTALLYLLVLICFTIFVVYRLERYRCVWFLSHKNPSKMTRAENFCRYVYSLMVLIERSDDSFFRTQLHTAFKNFHASIRGAGKSFLDCTKQAEKLITEGRLESSRPQEPRVQAVLLPLPARADQKNAACLPQRLLHRPAALFLPEQQA